MQKVFILKYGNMSDAKELQGLLRNNFKVVFATPLKDYIYYILE